MTTTTATTTKQVPQPESIHDDHDSISTVTTVSSAKLDDELPSKEEATTATRVETSGFLQRVVTNRSAIVPRKKRRGLLAGLSVIPEIEKPMEYKRPIKHMVTIVVAFAGASAPMASGILFPALAQISDQLGSTQAVTNLSVSTYMIGMAFAPLWWSSFAERWGYRSIFVVSFALYIICNVCAALSVNISMLIVFRCFSGASAASAQSVGAGVISTIWEVRERGTAMGLFYLGPLCGPLLSPIIGGLLTERFGWRATQWFLAIFGLAVWLCMIFCLPETLPVLERLKRPSPNGELDRTVSRVSARTKEHARALKVLLLDPLRSLLFMRFPPVFLTVFWAAMTFGSLYTLNVSIQKTFALPPYNYTITIIGLLYIPGSVGYIVASVGGGRWNDVVMRKAAEKRRVASGGEEPLEYRPEDRMGMNAIVAGTLFPLALMVYGWTVEEGVHPAAPLVATFFFGVGSMLIFSMATTQLTEFVPGKSSSAVAVNNFFRSIFSCVGSVIAEPLMESIGNGWLFTIFGILSLASVSVVWIMRKYGPRWRERADEYSKYM